MEHTSIQKDTSTDDHRDGKRICFVAKHATDGIYYY